MTPETPHSQESKPPAEKLAAQPDEAKQGQSPDNTPQPTEADGAEDKAGISQKFLRDTRLMSKVIRRSFKIGVLKRGLSMIAVTIAVLVLAWRYIVPDHAQYRIEASDKTPRDLANSRMIKPRFLSNDGRRQTYVITADEASEIAGQKDAIALISPTADLEMQGNNSQTWNYIRAEKGIYQPKRKILILSGRIVALRDDGMQFTTESLWINLETRDMTGNLPAEAHGPSGEILGQGVRLRNHGQHLTFTGAARMILRETNPSNPSNPSPTTAQTPATPARPTLVTASRGIEWQREQRRFLAHEDAMVVQENHTIRARKIVIWYNSQDQRQSQISDVKPDAQADAAADQILGNKVRAAYVQATGNAVISSEKDRITGEHANYDFTKDIAVVSGKGLRLDLANGEVVTATENIDYFRGDGLVVAHGQAVSSKADRRVEGDILSIKLRSVTGNAANNAKNNKEKSELSESLQAERMDGFGRVKITTAEQRASGDKARYYPDRKFARLLGNVKVSQGQSVLVGDYGDVDFANGSSHMLSGRDAERAGEQIKGLLNPDDAKSFRKGSK
ncbi:MAG: LPS export ABC transporter periplasmic protein LptC [Alphaproteobacteria bacterium]|nr:LPS export ABC transporter periplasmic protein LptC [Alphaproteobacteria bacterium]